MTICNKKFFFAKKSSAVWNNFFGELSVGKNRTIQNKFFDVYYNFVISAENLLNFHLGGVAFPVYLILKVLDMTLKG